MIEVSYIDKDIKHSLTDCLALDILNEYDKAIMPFLFDYLNDQSTIEVSTSGSTGTPKLIRLEKEKMVASAKATLEFFELKPGQKILLSLPTHFIAGKMIWVRAIVGNLKVVVSKSTSNPIKDLNEPIDFAAMTPHQVAVCLDENPEKFEFIDKLIIGGGAVNSTLLARLQNISTSCYSTYGMTETITHVAIKKLNSTGSSDVFSAIHPTHFTIGKKDNLVIYAPHLSSSSIETNDVVELIDDFHFRWLGRLDFVINSGGVKLFPEQIEKKLENVIESNFFVWKEANEILGEKLILVIEGAKTNLPDLDPLLTKLEQPKAIYFIDKFCYTGNGKLDRKSSFDQIAKI